jgi:methyl-accepting chemotaxis protein
MCSPEHTREVFMGARIPAVRRTDSLYAQLGGKANLTAVVEKFYEKMLADPEIKPFFARVTMSFVRQRQVQFLTQALGGPVDPKNRDTQPGHSQLLPEPRHFDRAATHLAVALSEIELSPDLVDSILERIAAAEAELGLLASASETSHELSQEEMRQREDLLGQIAAISKSQAVIEFQMDGIILNANENFLRTVGYSLDEIKGKHHRMFVEESQRESLDYKEFWARLGRGEYQTGEFKHIAQGGREIWLQASYNPILDTHGKPFKVVKYATDITRQKKATNDYTAQIAAISKSQAVIEFQMDGTIVNANGNFLRTVEYSLEEVKGKHHRALVDDAQANSTEYKEFWAKLNRGEYQSGEFRRVGKGGKEVWLHASYNPILDLSGKPFKVVTYATDVSQQKSNADLSKKVDAMLIAVSAASKGDLTQEIIVSGKDAIGQMGVALAEFIAHLRSSIGKIGQTAATLSAASGELTIVSQQMSASAEQTSSQAQMVSKNSEQVNRNLQTVATGTEEMGASIKEIAKNATEAAKVATAAVKVAETTNATVLKLGESSTEIGQVIKVITSIAQQTNLLALNATIEAARAGEAGKGFAVVANEVKELAKETAKATEDISRKIETIQADARAAVEAITTISGIINQVNYISSTIATAVEEQNATTNEMARNLSEAANGSGEITKNISGVAEAATNTAQGANDSQRAAQQLSQMSEELQQLVEQFKY